MAETKTFLSHAGLQHYDAKIKEFIKKQGPDVTDKLIALIGAAEKGADQKTILARIEDLERVVGNISELPEYQNLVAAILGESNRAKAAEKGLGDRLNVIEGEAEGSIKKALADAKTYADGKDAAIAAAKKAGDDAQSDLNTYKGTVSTTYETKADATAKLTEAKGYTDTEIGKVNTKIGTVADGKTVVGLINEAKQAAIDEASYDDTQVKADIAANTAAITTLNGNASTAGSVAKAVADAKSALETEIAKKADSTTVSGIEGRVATIEGDYLKAADKTELEGKIKTNADAIGVLNGEGAGSIKKKIDDAFNDFATKVSDDNVVNTYKELVDYCATHSSEAAEMAGDIDANATAITELERFIGTLPEGTQAATVIAYINEKVGAEKTRAEGVESGLDTRLVAVEAKLGNGEGSVDAKIEAAKNEAISTAANDATTKANTALNDAKSYVDGKLGNVGEEKGTVTARIKAIEDELAAAVTFEAISEEQINALFENK